MASVHPPQDLVQLPLTVPAGAQPGQVIQFQAPNGQMLQVQVPAGAPPGGQFGVMVPADAPASPAPAAQVSLAYFVVPAS
jgi:hypothetical protein